MDTTNVDNQKMNLEENILVGGITIPTDETILIPPKGSIKYKMLSKEEIINGLPTLVINAKDNKEIESDVINTQEKNTKIEEEYLQ